jgi:sigma-70-like protein
MATTRSGTRADFEEFVAACSERLMRTAYLLTGDRGTAEDLLQVSLARTWLAWSHLDVPPEPYTRSLVVDRYLSGRAHPLADDATGLGPLPRRQRAVLVLRYFDDLPQAAVAETLGSSPAAVAHQETRALAAVGVGGDELRLRLLEAADGLDRTSVPERLSELDDLVAIGERRRLMARVLGGLLACAAVVVAVLLVVAVLPGARTDSGPGPDEPTPEPVVDAPPVLVGYQLRQLLRVADVDYEYFRCEETEPGRELLRVAVTAADRPQALAWVSSQDLDGTIVVTVDGDVVSRAAAGTVQSGLLLTAHRNHLVTLRPSKPTGRQRLGVAIYRWPS